MIITGMRTIRGRSASAIAIVGVLAFVTVVAPAGGSAVVGLSRRHIRVTTSTVGEGCRYPSISGDVVAYVSDRTGRDQVWYRALRDESERRLGGPGVFQDGPSVSGDRIAYTACDRYGKYSVCVASIAGTVTVTDLTGAVSRSARDVSLSDELIAWTDYRDTWEGYGGVVLGGEVYALDLRTGEQRRLGSGPGSQDGGAAVSQGHIVWLSRSTRTFQGFKVHGYDWPAARPRPVADLSDSRVSIDGTHVAYGWGSGVIVSDWDRGVWLAELPVSPYVADVRISGEWVALVVAGERHVRLWRWTTGDVYDLTGDLPGRQWDCVIDGGRVAYTSNPSTGSVLDGPSDVYVTECALAYPDVSVEPAPILFGQVAPGSTRERRVSIRNVGDAPLVVTRIALNAAPALTICGATTGTIRPSGSLDMTLAFSPTGARTASSALRVESDDPDEPAVVVPVSGTGLLGLPRAATELRRAAAAAAASGTLVGVGVGQEANARREAFLGMLRNVERLVRGRRYRQALRMLSAAHGASDGRPSPRDIVAGRARPGIAARELTLIRRLKAIVPR